MLVKLASFQSRSDQLHLMNICCEISTLPPPVPTGGVVFPSVSAYTVTHTLLTNYQTRMIGLDLMIFMRDLAGSNYRWTAQSAAIVRQNTAHYFCAAAKNSTTLMYDCVCGVRGAE